MCERPPLAAWSSPWGAASRRLRSPGRAATGPDGVARFPRDAVRRGTHVASQSSKPAERAAPGPAPRSPGALGDDGVSARVHRPSQSCPWGDGGVRGVPAPSSQSAVKREARGACATHRGDPPERGASGTLQEKRRLRRSTAGHPGSSLSGDVKAGKASPAPRAAGCARRLSAAPCRASPGGRGLWGHSGGEWRGTESVPTARSLPIPARHPK